MNRELQVALIGLVTVFVTAVLGPLLRGLVGKWANGRVQDARDRRRHYQEALERQADIDARQADRLARLEEEVEELRRENLDLERRIVQVDELAQDLRMLEQVIALHLKDHPQFHRMMAILETMTIRMGRGIQDIA